jgi:hypothetical protein
MPGKVRGNVKLSVKTLLLGKLKDLNNSEKASRLHLIHCFEDYANAAERCMLTAPLPAATSLAKFLLNPQHYQAFENMLSR